MGIVCDATAWTGGACTDTRIDATEREDPAVPHGRLGAIGGGRGGLA